MPWYDRAGAIAGCTVYDEGKLVARDCTITLPELASVTAEVNAAGPIDLPITGQTETMELTIAKLGVDADIGVLAEVRQHELEIRAAQDMLTAGGTQKVTVPIKAFLRAIPKTVPGISIEFGEISENEIVFTAIRYRLLVNYREVLCIDKANNLYSVNGKNFGESVESLL